MGKVDDNQKVKAGKKRRRSEGTADAAGDSKTGLEEKYLASPDPEDLSSPGKKRKKKKERRYKDDDAGVLQGNGGADAVTTGDVVVDHQAEEGDDAAAETETRPAKKGKRRRSDGGADEQVAGEGAEEEDGPGSSSTGPAAATSPPPSTEEAAAAAAMPASSPGGAPLTSGLEMVRRLLSGHTRRSDLATPTAAQQQQPKQPSAPGGGSSQEEESQPPQPKVVVEEDPAVHRRASEMAAEWGLDRRLVPQLDRQGVRRFFAVQCRVLPYLISTNRADLVRDVVVSAPTGSGKTLVYVMALLQGLRERRIVRLRGLVVVPNRDLAVQVLSEFDKYAPALGIKVGLAIGQSDFSKEQASIVGPPPQGSSSSMGGGEQGQQQQGGGVVGGVSLVDVLVATPGRLMDHLERTAGFTLQHLKYLVIDEVDRLVTQSYQDWLHKVYEAAYGQQSGQVLLTPHQQPAHLLRPATVRVRPESKLERPVLPALPAVPLRKLLFSATVTANPQKLALLDLRNPRYFSITSVTMAAHRQQQPQLGEDGAPPDEDDDDEDEPTGRGKQQRAQFSTPERLEEWSVACSTEGKPLVLLQLLSLPALSRGLVLVFTSSLDSTHRLARLLQLCLPAGRAVEEWSSALTQPQRAELIRRCAGGGVGVLVSSDGMARGIDLPNVDSVVNYDVPARAKTYVHRVGRSARAGRAGASYSLVKRGQEQHFERMRASVDHKRVQPLPLQQRLAQAGVAVAEDVVPAYRRALGRLKGVLALEKQGRLKPWEPLPHHQDEGDDDDDDEEGQNGDADSEEQDDEELIEGPEEGRGAAASSTGASPHYKGGGRKAAAAPRQHKGRGGTAGKRTGRSSKTEGKPAGRK